MKAMKKFNKKLQLRVQTFEKKFELQQIKEQRRTTMFDQTNDELEQIKIERDTYLTLVMIVSFKRKKIKTFPCIKAKTKEEELNKTQTHLMQNIDKLSELERRLESYRNKSKERANEAQEQ